MFSLPALPYKLLGMAMGALAVLAFVLMAFHWKAQASDRKDQLSAICQATRGAAGQPKLDCKQVPQQIQFMGQAIGTLTTALHNQNEAVDAMGRKTAAAQAEAEKAVSKAATRARGAEDTARRLEASSRSTAPSSASQGQFSNAFEDAWQ